MPAPSRNATIALAAGGTGGHLFPAEALARELQRRGRAVVIYTERRGAQYAKALEGIPHLVLPARSLAGGVAGKLAAAFVILRAVLQARRDMKRRGVVLLAGFGGYPRSEEHTSELQSLMRISYAVLCLKTKKHEL